MDQNLKDALKAIAMLLDNAVLDYEKDDETIEAVDFATSVLRKYPNDTTKLAMEEYV